MRPFHSYLRASDVSLLWQNLFGIPGIREPSRLDAPNSRFRPPFKPACLLEKSGGLPENTRMKSEGWCYSNQPIHAGTPLLSDPDRIECSVHVRN